MSKKDRLRLAYNYLRGSGLANTQQDVADAMGSPRSSISIGFKDPNDNFLKRFNKAYDDVFNLAWLTLGEGSMLRETKHTNNFNIVTGESAHDNNLGSNVTIQSKPDDGILQELVRTNSKLTETNSKLTDQIDRLTNLLDRLTK